MFKKTLATLAVLGAFTGASTAATFDLYGVIDQALAYDYNSVTDHTGIKNSTDSFGMKSGLNAVSRFGFRGSEDLGNGLKVGFNLENAFSGDDGTLASGNRLFHREAQVNLSGAFGTIALGRMGGVGSSAGKFDLVYGTADAFDGGDNAILGIAISDRYDNMVTYQTPTFAGMQATVQYSFKENNVNDSEREGSAFANRYASAALTGSYGALNTVVAYEFQNYSSKNGDVEDGHTVYVGGNYNCGFATTFAMVQYFKGIDAVAEYEAEGSKKLSGYGLHLGSVFPALGGDVTVGLYFVDAKDEYKAEADRDISYIGGSARYAYSLSKRTTAYIGAGYAEAKQDARAGEAKDAKTKIGQAYFGLTHTF